MTSASSLAIGAGRRRPDLHWLDPWTWLTLGLLAGLPVLYAGYRYPAHALVLMPAAAGLALVAWLLFNNPAWGACLLIVIIYWNASDVVTETFGFGWLLRLAMLGTGVAAAWDMLTSERRATRWPLLLPFAAYGLVQVLASYHVTSQAAALGGLFEYAKAVVVFYLIVNLLRTPKTLRWAVDAVLTAAILLSLPVVYQGLTGSSNQFWGFGSMVYKELVPGQFGWRLGGAMGDPNFLAMVLVATLPLALIQALAERASWRRRGFALAAVGLTLAATAFSYSRAAFIGVGLVIVVLAIWHRRRQWVIAGTLAALLMVVAARPADLLARLATLQDLTQVSQDILPDSSLQIRRNAIYAGALMFADHPLLGVGPQNYPLDYEKYSAIIGMAVDPTARDPHDLYIQVAAETGILGVLAFAYLLWASFGMIDKARRRLRRLRAGHFADMVFAIELSMATYLTLSLFLHAAYFRHFYLLMALGAAAWEMVAEMAARPAIGNW